MLSLKLVRSLVLGDPVTSSLLHHHHGCHDDPDHDDDDDGHHDAYKRSSRRRAKNKATNINTSSTTTTTTTTAQLLLFVPTREVVKDTYRLATIARDMGMDLHPDPSLSHIIFSWPSPTPSTSTSSSTSSSSSSPSPYIPWSSSSLSSTSSSSWAASQKNAVPLPFPSLINASPALLGSFVGLSKGLFKLVQCRLMGKGNSSNRGSLGNLSNWDCSSLALFSRVSGERVDDMDGFVRALAGMGWSVFKTKTNPSLNSGCLGSGRPLSLYLFRKIESNRVLQVRNSDGGGGEFRIRELRLPNLDFRNAPLKILQYILLMTNDMFYLA